MVEERENDDCQSHIIQVTPSKDVQEEMSICFTDYRMLLYTKMRDMLA